MGLQKCNKQIVLSGEEAINILSEVEYILIPLRDIACYYYDNSNEEISAKKKNIIW